MLQNLRTQPQVNARHGGEMTQSLSKGDKRQCPEEATCTAKHYRTCNSPRKCFSHLLGPAASCSLRESSMWLLAHEHPFLPDLLCPSLSGAEGFTWDMKANIITPDVRSGLCRLCIPSALGSLFILSYAGMWVKRLRSLSGSAVLASYTALSKLLNSTGEARWLVLGMF